MAVLAEVVDDVRSDEAGAADDDDLHVVFLSALLARFNGTVFDVSVIPVRLDVDGDLDLVADEETAAFERLVPVEPEVLAVDLCPRRELDDVGIPPAGHAGLVGGQVHRSRDALDRQVAGHEPADTTVQGWSARRGCCETRSWDGRRRRRSRRSVGGRREFLMPVSIVAASIATSTSATRRADRRSNRMVPVKPWKRPCTVANFMCLTEKPIVLWSGVDLPGRAGVNRRLRGLQGPRFHGAILLLRRAGRLRRCDLSLVTPRRQPARPLRWRSGSRR